MAERNTKRDGRNASRPTGDPCPDCSAIMDVGSWSVSTIGTESITWQECDDCEIGWGPFSGWIDTAEEEPIELGDTDD